LNLFHLRYFVKLAEEQHYTKAAEKLCITQPSLSSAISQLEKELGIPLFEKNHRRVRLTPLGEQFLASVQSSLDTLDAGIESVKLAKYGDGVIRLGILRIHGVEYVPNLISHYLKERPDRKIHFTIETDTSPNLIKGLEENKYDIVICSPPEPEKKLDTILVNQQDMVLIVPNGHPLANRHSIDLKDTLEYPYVYFKKGLTGLRPVVDRLFEQIGQMPQIAYEIVEDQVVAGMVAAGFGIGLVPYMDILHRLNVKIIQISYPSWERNFYMVTDPKRYLSPVCEDFKHFVTENYQLHSDR